MDAQLHMTSILLSHEHSLKFNSEGPSIENFQIVGEATPGSKLLACGYPTRGTSLCIFQVTCSDII